MKFALLLCLWTLSAYGQQSQEQLTGILTALEAEYGGHLGVCAKNLVTGETIAYNAAERFPTASAIKLPVMATFFHLVEIGSVDPSMRVVLQADDKKPGSGILQFLSDGTDITLLDAVKLMILLSDNTSTNLVLDRLAPTHAERMKVVNDFMVSLGLKNTRILNRLYTWQTKLQTPESIRYGIGVSTPEDMVLLLDRLYTGTLADSSSCRSMLDILKSQFSIEMIPRYFPASSCTYLHVAHKTGGIREVKVDVGLVLSDRATFAVAIFVDKHPDHSGGMDNRAVLLVAHVARAIWNHFTGDTGYENNEINAADVDWNQFPGGQWGIYRSHAAPFPHPLRMNGFRRNDSTFYPYYPHYADSSIVVFVPEGFEETADGTNLIVHFHGHMNDNLGVLERYLMPQAMISEKINALLVIPQGPYRARDSFGGKMEDPGGFQRLVEDVLATMNKEKIVTDTRVGRIIVSAHSGGYRPAAYALKVGGLREHITDVFLFDAFYADQDAFRDWLLGGSGILRAAYTQHLEQEHTAFLRDLGSRADDRAIFTKTTVEHDSVVQAFFPSWLSTLGEKWKLPTTP
jgi:beta-lactamase class A